MQNMANGKIIFAIWILLDDLEKRLEKMGEKLF